MNKDYIIYNLKESLESLVSIIENIEKNEEYENGEYSVDMQHLYHHLNTAWNARNTSKLESEECSEENFGKWREFPSDIYMGL